MDYKSLFAFALSVAISRGADDPEDVAQEAIVRLWLQGERESPRGYVAVTVERMIAKERVGREKESAAEARVRYRPGEEGLEWVEENGCLTEDGFEQAVIDQVFLQQVRRKWGNLWRAMERLGEVREWAGV